jgi:hypothetical protein
MTVPKETEIKAITIVSPFHTVVLLLPGFWFGFCCDH